MTLQTRIVLFKIKSTVAKIYSHTFLTLSSAIYLSMNTSGTRDIYRRVVVGTSCIEIHLIIGVVIYQSLNAQLILSY